LAGSGLTLQQNNPAAGVLPLPFYLLAFYLLAFYFLQFYISRFIVWRFIFLKTKWAFEN
tara:strand:- start:718 stop:894 length:177 start_codon:yes stop_codon:yes gene_type:complete